MSTNILVSGKARAYPRYIYYLADEDTRAILDFQDPGGDALEVVPLPTESYSTSDTPGLGNGMADSFREVSIALPQRCAPSAYQSSRR